MRPQFPKEWISPFYIVFTTLCTVQLSFVHLKQHGQYLVRQEIVFVEKICQNVCMISVAKMKKILVKQHEIVWCVRYSNECGQKPKWPKEKSMGKSGTKKIYIKIVDKFGENRKIKLSQVLETILRSGPLAEHFGS